RTLMPPLQPTSISNAAWDRPAAAHVLRRVGFGASAAAVDAAVEAGLETTLAELESRREHSSTLTGHSVDKLVSMGNLVSLQSRWMSLILGDGAPLVERVTLMWHGHFATSNSKVGDVRLMHEQNELFRQLGLGDFRVLLHAIAKDPAMLVWLDGNQNRVGAPNENFAREVMELFGLGIEGGYTEGDIQEAARAFSGWSVIGRRFQFREEHHDSGEKKLFGRSGIHSGEEAIDAVLAHPACPRWIAWRLLHTFVEPEPPARDIKRFASVLVEEDWHVGRTLARIFRDPIFLGPKARRSRIAGPVELVAGVVLATGADIPPVDGVRAAGVMGQTLFMPPTVKGWDGGRAWIDPGTWLARHNWLSDFALAKGLDAKTAFGASSRDQAVDAVLRVLVPEGVDAPMRSALNSAARSAHSDGHALHKVAALVLTSPEYHLI
ncbi:MAG: DUF1800 domain-containing protein, partial [Planctomycetota bacterium]